MGVWVCFYPRVTDMMCQFHYTQSVNTSLRLSPKYTWNAFPQGFVNSPTLFHQCLAKILEHFSKPECLVQYVDVLLLQTATMEEHLTLLAEFLKILREAGLKLSLKKLSYLNQKSRHKDKQSGAYP